MAIHVIGTTILTDFRLWNIRKSARMIQNQVFKVTGDFFGCGVWICMVGGKRSLRTAETRFEGFPLLRCFILSVHRNAPFVAEDTL